MLIFDRKSKSLVTEEEPSSNALDFLYNNFVGRVLLKIAVSPLFSKIASLYYHSHFSKSKISAFCKKHSIDITNAEQYACFNDFFIRKKDFCKKSKPNDINSVANAKLLVLDIDDNLILDVKHSKYQLQHILMDKGLSNEYNGGKCLIFRLSLTDCHRYAFPDDGVILKNYHINGELHTVRPISAKYNVFSRNSREITVMQTTNFGKVVQIEIGAMLVGKICNHSVQSFSKLDEKGYFEYGGSTVILLLKDTPHSTISIDADILAQSRNGIETKVSIGEHIGQIIQIKEI